MWVFSILLLCASVVLWARATPPVEWPLKAVTWNVNGVSKIRDQLTDHQYLKSFDVVLLQETFSTADTTVYELDGYISFHSLARVTGGRPQWGMTSLISIPSVVGGRLYSLRVPSEWMLACRWVRPSGLGVLIVNIYIPVHSKKSGITPQDIEQLSLFFRDLSSSFPGDTIICGGDFNVDRWRLSHPRRPPTILAWYYLKQFTF
jgi:exonuclease III